MIDAEFHDWDPGLPQLSRLAGQPLSGLGPLALATVVEDVATDALRTLGAEEAEYTAAVLQQAMNIVSAAQAVLLDTVATRLEEEAEARGVRWGGGRQWHDAASALAPLLHLAPMTMSRRLDQAHTLVHELPYTLALAREGHLEPWRVGAIVGEAECLGPGLGPVFDARLHARDDVLHLPAARLRARAARTVAAVDPRSIQDRAEQARCGRYVRVSPGEDPGMTRWNAYHPADTSAVAWAAIDELAQEYLTADPQRGVQAARGDAMIDLILQRATVQATITLAVPTALPADPVSSADTPTTLRADPVGSSDIPTDLQLLAPTAAPSVSDLQPTNPSAPKEERSGQPVAAGYPRTQPDPREAPADSLPTVPSASTVSSVAPAAMEPGSDRCVLVNAGPAGWLLADAVAALLAHPSTTVRLAAVEPVWSTIRSLDQPSYRPRAALDRAIRERDGTCRFPGCATPAHRCDLDHVRPYPAGPTTADNLLTLCRRHHGFKHHANWTVVMSAEGEVTWTSPTGRTHTTLPRGIHDLVA